MLTRREAFSLLYLDQLDPCSSQAIEPSAFATKVAQQYAAKGFSMTAVNVQSLIAEAEDALASMNRLNSSHTKYVLQYMAVQLEYMFGWKSHKWLSELRRMHDRC